MNDKYQAPSETIEGFIRTGCISEWICPQCKLKWVCESSGKADTQPDKDKGIRYMWGPCCCGMCWCDKCGYEAEWHKQLRENPITIETDQIFICNS